MPKHPATNTFANISLKFQAYIIIILIMTDSNLGVGITVILNMYDI